MSYFNTKLDDFEKSLNNKKVAIIGLGVSNLPMLDYLHSLNAKVSIFDKKNKETLLKQNADREYIVKSVCSFCYTVIRAGAFDLSKEDVLDDMSVSSYRYEFDNESEEQIRNILNNKSDIDYKGHFYRGVN